MNVAHDAGWLAVPPRAESPRLEATGKQPAIRGCAPRWGLSVVIIAVLFLFGAIPASSSEPSSIGYLNKDAHGVLALGVFTGMDGREDLPPQGPVRTVTVRMAAKANATILMKLTQAADVEALETAYEMNTAVVYGQQPGWFQIQTRAGRGWVAQAECGKFTPVEDLLRNKMTYLLLDVDWNRLLYQQPNLTAAQVHAKAPEADLRDGHVPATMLEWKWSQGQAWIKVSVHAKSYDDPAFDGSTGTIGWLPAYRENLLIMWLFSRGM